jgi:hypothetical protein
MMRPTITKHEREEVDSEQDTSFVSLYAQLGAFADG